MENKSLDFLNNSEFIEGLVNGSHSNFETLIDYYHKPLSLYAYSLSKDLDLSKDVVQNVFFKFWVKRKDLEHIKSLKNYLFKSVYNEFSNQMRHRKKISVLEQKHFEILNQIILNQDEDLSKSKIDLVCQEINKLPQKCKETLLLSKMEGLTNQEISNYMNVSKRTVENQISKAFRIIRQKLRKKMLLFLISIFRFGIGKN